MSFKLFEEMEYFDNKMFFFEIQYMYYVIGFECLVFKEGLVINKVYFWGD